MKRILIFAVIIVLAAASVFAAAKKNKNVTAKNTIPAQTKIAPKAGESQDAYLERVLAMPDSTVIAKVNGVAITKGQLIKQLWQGEALSELSALCEKNAIYSQIKKEGITVSDAEIQDELNAVAAANQIKDLDAYLAQKGISKSKLMSEMRMNLLIKKYGDKKFSATRDDVKKYVKASHILVKFDAEAPEEERDAKCLAKIQEINAKVKAGEDFAQLAKDNSEDGSASLGGSLGWFDDTVSFVPEFKTAVFTLEEGQVSEPVKTEFGYHLIKVDKLGSNATQKDLEEINNSSAFASKRNQELNKWLSGILADKSIENYLAITK